MENMHTDVRMWRVGGKKKKKKKKKDGWYERICAWKTKIGKKIYP